ncbi:ATP-binding protein [Myroides odoratimimus]|uniref:sensor histidine kinase n=1 Tax=Myroides odoratimimus TaxID=76832 RepID=UPI00217FD0A1|nr:ATP-binding protein [Myroides odoratimimus]MCS7473416.1 ATP-binding protein [Myroides odoratimimus]MDM1084847.1 ATP-binding protein [Myroides odoratimimus]MDM1457885.1 ATP-binding protein [Myroides odoratimimus]
MFKKYILYCLLIPFFLSCTKSKERQLDVQKQTQELDLIDKEENSDSIHYVETSRLAKRLLLLGNAYYYKQNNLANKEDAYNEKNKLTYEYLNALKNKDSASLANTYFDLGEYYQYTAISDSSYYYYNKSVQYYKGIKNIEDLQKTYLYFSILLASRGVFLEAHIQLLQAISLNGYNVSKHTLYSQAFVLAVIELGLDKNDEAITMLKKAEAYLDSEELKNFYLREQILMNKISIKNNLSRAYIEKGEYNDAEEAIQEAFRYLEQLENKDKESFYSMLLHTNASLQLKYKNYDTVISYIVEAMDHSLTIGNYHAYNLNKILYAEYQLERGEFVNGIKLLEEVFSSAAQYDDLRIQKKAIELLMMYDKIDSKSNFYHYKQINELINKDINAVRSKFARLKYESDSLIRSNQILKDQNNLITYASIALIFSFIGILCVIFYRNKAREIALVQMYQKDTEKYYDSIIHIQNSITRAQELERKKFAKELHDGVLNKLFVTRFSLLQLENDNLELVKESLVKEVQEVELFIRNSSHALYNEEKFLVSNFGQLLEELVYLQNRNVSTVFSIEIDSRIELERLSHKIKVNIYRVLQEAFQNVQKYAEAKECKLVIEYLSDQYFRMEVIDNGKGFSFKSVKRGLGIKNMEERLRGLNSKLIVKSKRGIGTSISFSIQNS